MPLPVNIGCDTCKDRSLVVYEPCIAAFICTGCACVLEENVLELSESTQARNEKLTANLTPFEASSSSYLSHTAAASASRIRSSEFEASKVARLRRNLRELCAKLQLPSDYSSLSLKVLLRHFLPSIEKGDRKNISKAKLVASIYSVCRRESRSFSLSNICERLSVRRAEVGRALRQLRERSSRGPPRFVHRAVSLLGGSGSEEQIAFKIIELLDRHDLVSGRCPVGIALAAAFLSFKDRSAATAKLKHASEILGASIRTVNRRVKEVSDVLRRAYKVLPSDPKPRASQQWDTAFVLEYIDLLVEPLQKKQRLQETPYVPLPEFNNENSGSDLSSDDEQSIHLRSDLEVQKLMKIQRKFGL